MDSRRTSARARTPPVYYTEWNTSSNPRGPLHDEPYAAAFVAKTVMEASGLVEGYSFWTFSDIFAENYFPSVPFHGGFGLLNLQGIPKPAYRAFELLHRLGTEQLTVGGMHDTVDAWAVQTNGGVTLLLTNNALPGHPIKKQQVRVRLTQAPQPRVAFLERIDEEHANPKKPWREMGQPEFLNAKEAEQLQAASRIVKEAQSWLYERRAIHLDIELPPYAVAAITVEFATLAERSTVQL